MKAYVVMVGLGRDWRAMNVAANGSTEACEIACDGMAYASRFTIVERMLMQAHSRRAPWLDGEYLDIQPSVCEMLRCTEAVP